MGGFYYKVWADAIRSERSKRSEGENWKLYTLIPISALQGFNLLTILYWMKIIVNPQLPLFFPVNIFAYATLNSFIGIMITLFLPFVILNYLLIFNNNRYEKFIKEYPDLQGTLYKKYALFSLGILFIPLLISKVFFS